MQSRKNNVIAQLYDYCDKNTNIYESLKIIGFLLNDNKFANWDNKKSKKYTIEINKFLFNNNVEYIYGLRKDDLKKTDNKHQIRIAGNGRQSELLIKGIRNGIVHLNAKLKVQNGITYIIIDDESAKINIPIKFIKTFYEMYKKIN